MLAIGENPQRESQVYPSMQKVMRKMPATERRNRLMPNSE